MIRILPVIALLLLTGCAKEAHISARTGSNSEGSENPYIECKVIVSNPDFVPPTSDTKP